MRDRPNVEKLGLATWLRGWTPNYHEQTGIVGGLPVGPVTTDPAGQYGIRMYPDQDPGVLEETRRYFEKLAEQFDGDLPRA